MDDEVALFSGDDSRGAFTCAPCHLSGGAGLRSRSRGGGKWVSAVGGHGMCVCARVTPMGWASAAGVAPHMRRQTASGGQRA
eukprot:2428873-Pyramimonas_sp.AAC.1